MGKYLLFLLPIIIMAIYTGCDGACCSKKETTGTRASVENKKPTAQINGLPANLQCTPGDTITLSSGSTDSDGSVSETIWEVDGAVVASPSLTCPDANQTTQVCLTAVDNDGLESDKVCSTITGEVVIPVTTTTKPKVTIELGARDNDGQTLSCENVSDTDTVRTYPNEIYPYGGGTIKEVDWTYTYHYEDGSISGPHYLSQTQYNDEQGQDAGTCHKWFHTVQNGLTVVTLDLSVTATDDDNETATSKYIYNAADGTLIKQ